MAVQSVYAARTPIVVWPLPAERWQALRMQEGVRRLQAATAVTALLLCAVALDQGWRTPTHHGWLAAIGLHGAAVFFLHRLAVWSALGLASGALATLLRRAAAPHRSALVRVLLAAASVATLGLTMRGRHADCVDVNAPPTISALHAAAPQAGHAECHSQQARG